MSLHGELDPDALNHFEVMDRQIADLKKQLIDAKEQIKTTRGKLSKAESVENILRKELAEARESARIAYDYVRDYQRNVNVPALDLSLVYLGGIVDDKPSPDEEGGPNITMFADLVLNIINDNAHDYSCEVETQHLVNLAMKAGLMRQEPYDPDKHTILPEWGCKPGDVIYVWNTPPAGGDAK